MRFRHYTDQLDSVHTVMKNRLHYGVYPEQVWILQNSRLALKSSQPFPRGRRNLLRTLPQQTHHFEIIPKKGVLFTRQFR